MRVIKIQKVGKSTVIEVINENQQEPQVHVINKLTNLTLRNNVIEVRTESDFQLMIQYDELFDKLASTDIKDYLHKAAALFLFNQ